MEYLQYLTIMSAVMAEVLAVLNLVISGIPSIQEYLCKNIWIKLSFKPCYKWNTFNTKIDIDGFIVSFEF